MSLPTPSRADVRRLAADGLMLAAALILSWLEAVLPLSAPLPGFKLGLANIVTMLLLYIAGVPAACLISALRILLSGFLFGSGFAMVYSAAGAAMSMLVMALLKKTKKFSSVGVSVAGGIFHNVGQIIVAMIVLETKALAYYLPILILSGLVAGILIGILSGILTKRLNPIIKQHFV